MTRTVRVGDEYEGGSLPIGGSHIPFRVSMKRRDGDPETAIPDPYRSITRYPSLSRTPVSICHVLAGSGAPPIAPLTLVEAGGSCIAMIDQHADPISYPMLRRPEVRRTDDLVAIVNVMPGHLPRPGDGKLLAPSPLIFETVDREGRPVTVWVEEVATVRIEWDRKSGRAVVDVGRGRTIPVEAFGYGLYSADNGTTRVDLEAFVKARTPSYRRTPAVHQALTRAMVPLRRTDRDREMLEDCVTVRETGIVAGNVTDVELTMSLGDEQRARQYGTKPRRSKRSRSVEATMPLAFDEVKVSASVSAENLKALREAKEQEAETTDTAVNKLLRKLASEVFIRQDTLTLRTYCAIVTECRGDSMEWVENPSQIIRLLGGDIHGKSAANIRQRINDLKTTKLTLTVSSEERTDIRELPLFAPSGTVSSKDRRTGRELMPEGRPRPVWMLHPLLVAWMNSDGGHFAYLDQDALRLGDLATEWEFRAYLVLCDRWAAALAKRRKDPERAEFIKAGSLLDAAGIDWRDRYGYAAKVEGREAAASPRRPKEFFERFNAMAARLVDSGLVQFADVSKASDDPVESVWRFVAPRELRSELEVNSSKRLAAAERGDRQRLAKRLKGALPPDATASG